MDTFKNLLIEGIDRLGKNTLIEGIQNRFGYYLELHYQKPLRPRCYLLDNASAERKYQEVSFRAMFQLLSDTQGINIICNRAHLGECVYAPLYRQYSGEYVFDIERDFRVQDLPHTRLILLTEDFEVSRHFTDDGRSLGGSKDIVNRRRREQELFLSAFGRSALRNKKAICVTDRATGEFKPKEQILDEALS